MAIEEELIEAALGDPGLLWFPGAMASISGRIVPTDFLGRGRSAIVGDIHTQWIRWFVESFFDPQYLASNELSYGQLFSDVLEKVKQSYPTTVKTLTEQKTVAASISRAIQRMAPKVSRRTPFSPDLRRLLVDLSGSEPHCYICGYRFSEVAIDNFLLSANHSPCLPLFVDVFKPRGMKKQDLRIEVDHVHPFSRGGGDDENLRLACGWCNRHKSARLSIYEVGSQALKAQKNSIGIHTLPQPFWVVRLIALSTGCEHPEGCSTSVSQTELTVTSNRQSGSLNPMNIRVTCLHHDPMKSIRLQPVSVVNDIWGGQAVG